MNLTGVKPAKDWVQRHFTFNFNLESLIADAQADAFAAGVQQGLTEAAGFARQFTESMGNRHSMQTAATIESNILAARDAKKGDK